MTTKSEKSILPDINDDQVLKEYLSNVSDIVSEIVNYGTTALHHFIKNKEVSEKNIASVILYRHALELLYSISLKIKHSCIETAKIELRVLFETMINLKYLYKKDFTARSLTYLFCEIMDELRQLEKEAGGITVSDDTMQIIKEYGNIENIQGKDNSITDENILNTKKMLSQVIFTDINAEYMRLIKNGYNHPKWYQFYNGPKQIKNLAKDTGEQLYYEIIYRSFSGRMHYGRLLKSNLSNIGLTPLNSSENLNLIINLSVIFGTSIIEIFYLNEFPDKEDEYFKWYRDEITPSMEKYVYTGGSIN